MFCSIMNRQIDISLAGNSGHSAGLIACAAVSQISASGMTASIDSMCNEEKDRDRIRIRFHFHLANAVIGD